MEGFSFPVTQLTDAESADARSRMADELHCIERDGIPAPGTPDQAFPSGGPDGQPRRVPTNVRLLLPMLAHLLDEPDLVMQTPASGSDSSSSSTPSSSSMVLLQTNAHLLSVMVDRLTHPAMRFIPLMTVCLLLAPFFVCRWTLPCVTIHPPRLASRTSVMHGPCSRP